jgi:hypothetical protein
MSRAWGLCRSSQARKVCSNGGGGRSEELVNSKSLLSPLYSFLMKERGLRRGARNRNGSPLTGRKIAKLPRCPQAMVSAKSNHLKNDSANDVTRIRVTGKNLAKVWYDNSTYW